MGTRTQKAAAAADPDEQAAQTLAEEQERQRAHDDRNLAPAVRARFEALEERVSKLEKA
jgi:hypothetical protein